MDEKVTIANDSYYDGVPQWMLDMSLEEIEAAIEEEKKKLEKR